MRKECDSLDLYNDTSRVILAPPTLCVVESEKHTLLSALPLYVNSKTDHFVEHLIEAVKKRRHVRVVGVLKEHFADFCLARGLIEEEREDGRSADRKAQVVTLHQVPDMKKFSNTERPCAVKVRNRGGEKELFVVVTPGKDYVRHVAELVLARMHRIAKQKRVDVSEVDNLFQAWIFPFACELIMETMRLKDVLGDCAVRAVVVLGYVERFCSYIQSVPGSHWNVIGEDTLFSPSPDAYFARKVLENEKAKVVFLSMRYPFWGDISYYLVKKLVEMGVQGVVYGAKLGSLRAPKDIAHALIMPKSFAYLRDTGEPEMVQNVSHFVSVPAGAFARAGAHLSIPTIMMETQKQIDALLAADSYGSVDNEISQMARALSGEHASFCAVHFATDFLNVWQKEAQSGQNMLTITDDVLEQLKQRQAEIICSIVLSPALDAVPKAKTVLEKVKNALREKYVKNRLRLLIGGGDDVDRDVRLCDLGSFIEPQIRLGGFAFDRAAVEKKDQPPHSVMNQLYAVEHVTLSNLWKHSPANVIMYGKGGAGKSSLCSYIGFQAVKEKEPLWSDLYDLVLIVDVSEFCGADNVTLRDIVANVFAHSAVCDDIDEIFTVVAGNADRCLLVLDGLDEMWESVRFKGMQQFIERLFLGQVSNLRHSLILTRPVAGFSFGFPEKWFKCDILGFTVMQVDVFLTRFFGPDLSRAQLARQIFKKRPEIQQACLLPWHAALFCDSIGHRSLDEQFRVSILYKDMLNRLHGTYNKRLHLFMNQDAREWNDVVQELRRLAFECLKQRSLLIPLDAWIALDRSLATCVSHSGLLKSIGQSEYYFVHYTMREFLAAEYVNQIPRPRFDSKLCTLPIVPVLAMFLRFLGDIVTEKAKAPAVLRMALNSCRKVLPPSNVPFLIMPGGWDFGLDVIVELAAKWEISLMEWVKKHVNPPLFGELARFVVEHPWVMLNICDFIGGELLLQVACDQNQPRAISELLHQKYVRPTKVKLLGLGLHGSLPLINDLINRGAEAIWAVAGAAASGKKDVCLKLFHNLPQKSKLMVPLALAARNLHFDIVRELVEQGAPSDQDLAVEGEYSLSMVCFCALRGNAMMVDALLARQANIYDALTGACCLVDDSLFRSLLICSDVDPTKIDLNRIVLNGSLESLQRAISVGSRPSERYGWTPLMLAVLKRDVSVVEFLANAFPCLLDMAGKIHWGPPENHNILTFTPVGDVLVRPARASTNWTPLHMAAALGRAAVVSALLQIGAKRDIQNKDKWTPLNSSLYFGHREVARMLLNHDTVNVATENGYTPLHSAIVSGMEEIIPALLEYGAQISAFTLSGETPAFLASTYGRLQCLKLLMGADLDQGRKDGLKPIHAACENGHVNVVRYLISNKCKLVMPLNVATPMFMAARGGHLEVVRALLEQGVNVNVAVSGMGTPILAASLYGHVDVVSALLDAGANAKVKPSPMIAVCANGHVKIVRLLCKAGCRDYGDTISPLCVACEKEQWDVVQLLLLERAVTNSRGTGQLTPVMRIAFKGDLDLLNLCLDQECSLDDADNAGQTALFIACREGHVEVVERLCEKGASLNLRDNNDDSPLFVAAKKGHIAVVTFLLKKNAKANSCCGRWTPLTWACANQKVDMVKCLIEGGVSLDASDRKGKGAMFYALRSKNGALRGLVCNAGKK